VNAPRSVRRRILLLGLLGLLALLLALPAPPQAALAHPLDVYLQATYITVAPTQIVVELDLSPGVLVAPQILPALDTDGDQEIADAEGRAYADAVLSNVVLNVDGQPLALAVTNTDMPPYLTIQAGYGTIRIFTIAALADGMAGTHSISYRNNYAPTGSAYQVNAFVDKGAPIALGKQNRDSIQQSMTMDYAIGSVAPATAAPAATATTAVGVAPLVAALSGTGGGPWWGLLALAALLGGLHALTPGHGKTLVAAYLVGSRGTPGQAVLLGGTTTITHTASVFVVGLLALLAGRGFAAGALTTALELGAGLLVLLLGARLLWRRGRAALRGEADPAHGHSHDCDHSHDHDHDHDHHHRHPGRAGLGGVIALGISGGLTPCPEALGVMLVAISLGRVWQGLGLIAAFSVGLAATIIALGLALVLASGRVRDLGLLDRAWVRLLPLGSAALITALGGAMTVRGTLAALGVLG
jgi:nickel/cobalt exporter